MKIDVSSPSTALVVATTEMKEWVRWDSTEQTALINGLIRTEQSYAEKITNRALLTQTIDLYLDGFCPRIDLPRPPLQSVTSVTYRTQGSTAYANTAASTLYTVSRHGLTPYLELKNTASWPTDTLARTNPVRVRYVAGSTSVSEVPASIKTAIKLRAADGFVHREETVIAQPRKLGAADRLLALSRVGTFS